ncbi:MAG: enoyl-CoA hydratase/isomerase family protein [Rhodoferax sp.]|nr:enoyl-CoA hydratase/isomerase family protein [Rhodoferax sp.]
MSILVEHIEGVLEIRLNRPDKLNALTLVMARELLARVTDGLRDAQVRAILLRGKGRAFCAGKDRDDPPAPEFVSVLQDLAKALMNTAKPVVAAVHGWVIGAGLELMLNCDIAIASRGARFMLPEVNMGLFGTGAVASLLPRSVGLQKAKGMLMLGREVSATDAERWGLIWAVIDDENLVTEARNLARQLAAGDPVVLGAMKELLHRESIGDIAGALQREAQAHDKLGGRPPLQC